jgi:aldehyde:ferredoxin oxidoreductase
MQVKGQEVPMHDPRAKAALGVGYAINPHGADHCANLHDPMFSMDPGPIAMMHPMGHIDALPSGDLSPKKMSLFTDFHHYRAIADCGVICMFVPYSPTALTDLVQITTGWDTGKAARSWWDQTAERVRNPGSGWRR